MILSTYNRKDSPFVWVQYAAYPGDPKEYEKTSVRKDDPDKERKLAIALNELEARLLKQEPGQVSASMKTGWGWVLQWINVRYANRPRTQKIYTAQWGAILRYLLDCDLERPHRVTREDLFDYVAWRSNQVKAKSKRMVKTNTALGELKLWAMVMDEAVTRGLAKTNPLRKHGIEREDTEVKPDMDEATILEAYKLLEKKPLWMQRSFHIALHTGLRFSDTAFDRHQIRWASDQIVIEKPKGGRKKEFAIPIYPAIRDMIHDWYYNSREPRLWSVSEADAKITSLHWRWFFVDEMQRPDLCFHCTRVTFITSGLRAGIPENVMLKMVNHGSKLINRLYQRWTSDDVRKFAMNLSIPSGHVAKSQSRTKKPPSPRTKET